MLLNYSFQNFQSFRERVDVDLTINKKSAATSWIATLPDETRVSKLLAVIGANGSGKTALLKPLAFLKWFVSESFREPHDAPIPITPFALKKDEPTEIEATFRLENVVWRYTLRCTSKRVLFEALHQKKERFAYVFVREWNPTAERYEVKKQGFDIAQSEAEKARGNASLISTAAQFDVAVAKLLTNVPFATNINLFGRVPTGMDAVIDAAARFAQDHDRLKQASSMLASWDLGLSSVRLEKGTFSKADGIQADYWMPLGLHRSRGRDFELPFNFESSGTQGAFVLLRYVLPLLQVGGLAVIDEFENDLHPHMLEPILGLFANPETNPHNAQLIFTCHAIEVLNTLQKSQVMLVEKNEHCESEAYRMDEVEGIRADDNFYAKYMAGAYGAIPAL
jgi:uncharacterized protein